MIILEIFIGLTLVYFLYSLFASIIAERISLFIGMRARVLRQGIASFMNDSNAQNEITDTSDIARWIKDLFVVEPKEFKYSKAGDFYKESTIKYLAKVGKNDLYSTVDTKPSYISKENFLLTILNMLSKKSIGINEWEKIKFAIRENTLNLEPQTLQMFQDWLDRSNDNYVNFKNLIVDHFEDSMDRVNGWYKKKIRHILLAVGFVLCLIFNVDTFEILQVLSNDPDKRSEMVQLAIATSDAENSYLKEQGSETSPNKDSVSNANRRQKDSLNQIRLDRVKASYDDTHSSINKTISILGTGWNYPYSFDTVACTIPDENNLNKYFDTEKSFIKNGSISDFNSKFNSDFHSIKSYTSKGTPNEYFILGETRGSVGEKLSFISRSSHPFTKKFWGFMITAFALTLGAQFWFDLLKRLVSIRGVGENSDEKKVKPRNRDAAILQTDGLKPQTSDPVQIAYLSNLGSWENMSGFVSANIFVNDQNTRGIKIISEAGKSLAHLGNTLEVKIKKKTFSIPLFFETGEKGSLGQGEVNPNAIRQKSSPNGWGSIAGMVYSPKLGKNVALSCGHVVRYEKSPFLNRGNREIVFRPPGANIDAHFGTVENLVLSSFCDAGVIDLAKKEFEKSFEAIETTRSLTTSDEYKTHVVVLNHANRKLISDINTPLLGKVVNTGMYYSFNDAPSNTIRYFNLFMMKEKDNKKLSAPGDSGSLIRIATQKELKTYNADNVEVVNNATVENKVAVGILVGGAFVNEKHYSFGINITDVFEILQVEKYNPNI